MNAICLVIDRLHVGYMGCYGNAWVRTPTFDRLAAEGFVFDQALTDSPRLEDVCESYWSGVHGLWRRAGRESRSLPRELAAAGIATTLVADDARPALHPRSGDFTALVNLASAQPTQAAESAEQTQTARLFAAACDVLDATREPFCLWLHAGGIDQGWDAPREFRDLYAEDDEPVPPDFVAVPRQLLADDHDPDERWGICQAYAAQVSLIDFCLSGLLEWLTANPVGRETLLMVTAPRGIPLGEHGRIGDWDEALHAELVHVPLLIRFPDQRGASGRSSAIVQPADVFATLLDWFGLPAIQDAGSGRSLLPLVDNLEAVLRDRACVVGGNGERGIRTPAWYLRVRHGEERRTTAHDHGTSLKPDAAGLPTTSLALGESQLYKKPDDMWEVNDVANRCGEVVDALKRTLADAEAAAAAGTQAIPPPLEDVLLSGYD